jgi:hypothetical protein
MAVHKSHAFDELPDSHIWHLIESLESLHEGELGVTMLVACGERAISPLRAYLLYGKPASVPEARQRTVRALAELDAKEVLLEYMRAPKAIADPKVRLGEEAVENTAARALVRWSSEDVFRELLYIVERRPLAGVLESLAAFRRPETIPYFISALGDDVGYRSAEDALRALGDAAVPALINAARTPEPARESESPSSRLRRTRAVRLLADSGLTSEHWPALAPLINDSSHELAASVCRVALQIAPENFLAKAVERLFEALDFADWFVKTEIADSLCEHFDRAKAAVRAEIERRRRLSHPYLDRALPVLLTVERRIADQQMRRCLLK